jgi:heptaprenyl diphosphate synthase
VDITSDPRISGKTPGTDLREGVPTYAGLLVLQSGDPADARLAELLQRPLPGNDELEEALSLLRAHEALNGARSAAQQWADDARQCLTPLPDSTETRALNQLCDYVVQRTS